MWIDKMYFGSNQETRRDLFIIPDVVCKIDPSFSLLGPLLLNLYVVFPYVWYFVVQWSNHEDG